MPNHCITRVLSRHAVASNQSPASVVIPGFTAEAIRLHRRILMAKLPRHVVMHFLGTAAPHDRRSRKVQERIAPESVLGAAVSAKQRRSASMTQVTARRLLSQSLQRARMTQVELGREARRRVRDACRKTAEPAPFPWLVSNPCLQPLHLSHDEWTRLPQPLTAIEVTARNAAAHAGQPQPPANRPLPPDALIDFWRCRARVPATWSLHLRPTRFLLRSEGSAVCLPSPSMPYSVADAASDTTVAQLSSDVMKWLTSQWKRATVASYVDAALQSRREEKPSAAPPSDEELKSIKHRASIDVRAALRASADRNLVAQLWLDEGTKAKPSLRPLAFSSTMRAENIYNQRAICV